MMTTTTRGSAAANICCTLRPIVLERILVSRAWLLAGKRHSPYKVCGVQLFSVGRVGEQGW